MHAVIVGGGVIGLATAYQLARDGASVTVLDARKTGLGASAVNAGWVVPAHGAPVAGPGVVATSLKWMLRPDSPLFIRPSLRPSFMTFMYGMFRASNERDQRAGFAATLALAEGSIETFDDYRADGISFEMHNDGLLMAFTEQQNYHEALRYIDLLERYGLEPTRLEGSAAQEYEPLLSDAVGNAIAFPRERHLVPSELADGLHRRLEDMGVEILEDSPLEEVSLRNGNVHAVRAGAQRVEGDRFILAAGAWTGPLSRMFGHPLPVRPGKGYSVDVDPFPLRAATSLMDAHVAVTPFDSALRVAGTMEFGGLDEKTRRVRVDAIMRAPRTYFRDWNPPVAPITARAGMRPMTPDGLPIIGRIPGLGNAYVSSGHAMLGVTLAPGTATELSKLVLHDQSSPLLEPFSPARFRRGQA
ncbi:MAG: amino acid dehydrogenase [Leifsonia xyli]|nr:MAG: amino acid dehydrogenase [Leifsonia xyli]